jgi:GNAT superfamily N-acetyltransferase
MATPGRNPDVTVRMARAEDVGPVFELARGMATSAQVVRTAFERSYREALGHETSWLAVAEASTGVVGYLLGFIHPTFYANGPVALVEEVAVAQQWRRRGIGAALMAAFEQWAGRRGAVFIVVATRRAALFYTALGYEETATLFRKKL